MCDLTLHPAIDENELKKTSRRLKLWELDVRWHCAVIGTCLTGEEIIKLCNKVNAPVFDGSGQDYKRHSFVVTQARFAKGAAVAIHKMLEKKYARTLRQFAKAKTTQEVETLWEDALNRGYIPGPFWAVMTHQASSLDLQARVYGEVHMMSHLVGASYRADHRQMADLQKTVEVLQNEQADLRKSHRRALDKRDNIIGLLKKENAELTTRVQRSDELEAQLLEERDGASVARLEYRIDTLLSRVIQETERADQARAQNRELEKTIQRMNEFHQKDLARLEDLEKELLVMEQRYIQNEEVSCMRNQGCSGSEDLCGRCIAYIGGQTKQTAVFRDVVEQQNGQFIHHDGGLHDGQARLQSILAQADAVMFPVTCISHEASREIKKICQLHQKPFIPLRTQGLGAFTRGLEELEDRRRSQPSSDE